MPHIIEPPKPEDFKRVKCEHCFTLVGYIPNDVKEVNGRDISGGPDGYSFIVCPNPECSKRIVLETW